MRRTHTRASLGVILMVASLSFAGCTMVGDRLTGVQVQSHRPNECVRTCNQDFVADMKAETTKLGAALEACREGPEGEKKACYEAALTAFHAAVTALHHERKDCVNSCHRQGSGIGG